MQNLRKGLEEHYQLFNRTDTRQPQTDLSRHRSGYSHQKFLSCQHLKLSTSSQIFYLNRYSRPVAPYPSPRHLRRPRPIRHESARLERFIRTTATRRTHRGFFIIKYHELLPQGFRDSRFIENTSQGISGSDGTIMRVLPSIATYEKYIELMSTTTH